MHSIINKLIPKISKGKHKRNIRCYITGLIVIMIVLNFVPVKFAVKEEDIVKYESFDKGKEVYICRVVIGSYSDYSATMINNKNDVLYRDFVDVVDYSPYYMLNHYFYEVQDPPGIKNKYLIIGNTEFLQGYFKGACNFKTEEWYPIYPIKRASLFRDIVIPKSYLNIYDFNWLYILSMLYKSLMFRIILVIIVAIMIFILMIKRFQKNH